MNDCPANKKTSKGSFRAGENRLYIAALVSLILLVAGNVLYQDTYNDIGTQVGPVRVNALWLILVATAPSILFFVWQRRQSLNVRTVDVFLLATMAFLAIRGVAAANTVNGFGLVMTYVAYTLVIYYGALMVTQNYRGLKTIMTALVVFLAIAIVFALLEFAVGRNLLYGSLIRPEVTPLAGKGYHRSGSTLEHPVTLGLFLIQMAPLAVLFYLKENDLRKRIFWIALLTASAIALEVTFSKGALLSALIMGSIALVWMLWKRSTVIKAVLLLLVCVGLAVGTFNAVFHETIYAGNFSKARTSESFRPREYMWSRAPEVILDNLVIGVGLWHGPYEILKQDFEDRGVRTPSSIDNMYVMMLVEEGLVGTALIIGTITTLELQALNLYRRKGRWADWALPLALSMAALFLIGASSDSLWLWSGMVVFWLIAGILRGLYEMDMRGQEPGYLK